MCLYRVWMNSPLLIYLSVLLRAVCGVPFHNHKYLCQYPYVFISLSLHYFIISTYIDLSICILFPFICIYVSMFMYMGTCTFVHNYLRVPHNLPLCFYTNMHLSFHIHVHISAFSYAFFFLFIYIYPSIPGNLFSNYYMYILAYS